MSYSETTTTTTASNQPTGVSGIKPDVGYLKTLPGIFKIAEFVLCLIVIICISIWYKSGAIGWIQFVAVMGCIGAALFFVLHFMNIINSFNKSCACPGPCPCICSCYLGELIYYVSETVCFLIAAILAATMFGYHSSIGAACIFSFLATGVFAVDTFFLFRGIQMATTSTSTSSHAATVETTTTTTSYETKTQY